MTETNMNIMVPVDFSSQTNKVVEYALNMAGALDAKVQFIHIVESFSGYDMLLVHPSFDEISKDVKAKADQLMENLVDDSKDKVKGVSGEVMIGDVAEKLLEFAEGKDFDMMIVGSHGTKGLEKVLMGSVASKLAENAPCPVLIVKLRYLQNK